MGFKNGKIIDINECVSNNAGCEQKCFNEDGGYKCECEGGYRLADDQHSCQGISWRERLLILTDRMSRFQLME